MGVRHKDAEKREYIDRHSHLEQGVGAILAFCNGVPSRQI